MQNGWHAINVDGDGGGGGGGGSIGVNPGLPYGRYLLSVHAHGWSITGENGGIQIAAPANVQVIDIRPLKE